MKNLHIKLPLVSGGQLPLNFSDGKQLIDELCSDDIYSPPTCMIIEAKMKDNKIVTIRVPYDQTATEAFIEIS